MATAFDAWLFGKKQVQTADVSVGKHQLEEVFRSGDSIFDDDIASTENVLANGDSCYHELAKGMMIVLKSSLGFEEDVMRDASQLLSRAEVISHAAWQQAKSQQKRRKNSVYSPGSDYKLCHAQAKLAGAIAGALSEKMSEYLKGLFRIRKSYVTLRSIVEDEARYIQAHKGTIDSGNKQGPLTPSDDMVDSPLDTFKSLSLRRTSSAEPTQDDTAALSLHPNSPLVADISDEYTYTGAHLCFGIMLVALGMIPTTFQQMLRLIGFKGNREKGMEMLWQTTRFKNLHGAAAGLLLLSLYNAIRAVCDISDGEVYPKERCEALLAEMRQRYPKSVFWTLEEARMLSAHKELAQAIVVLEKPLTNPVRQLVALSLLEKSMYSMFIHDYQACTDNFIKSISLNKYSNALYYYDAASAQVELYRRFKSTDPAQAAIHKNFAATYYDAAINKIDRKQLGATELPFDTYVVRKIKKWQERACTLGIDLVDAVGVSPTEEMIYMYGGHKWMRPEQLAQSLASLDFSEVQHSRDSTHTDVDERCILALLKAVVHRESGALDDARNELLAVIKQDRRLFKGKLCDNWPMPSAHYEMAIISWLEKDREGANVAEKVEECTDYLNTVVKWGTYELDNRILLKAKSAQDVVANFKAKQVAGGTGASAKADAAIRR